MNDQEKPKPYRFGVNRKGLHKKVSPVHERTVERRQNGGWYMVRWDELARGDFIRVREPQSNPFEDVPIWLVDGFLPDGTGVFATQQPNLEM